MVLIVCAMESEAREIKKAIKDLEIFDLSPQKYYYKGILKGKPVALVVTGIGKVNSSIMTSLVLAKESFDYIVNIGYAGGVLPYKVGDSVVIKDASYHDVDVTSINNMYEVGQVPNMPHPFLSDFELVKKLKFTLKANALSLYTGDKFMTQKIHDAPGVYDMEGAAIYQAAYIFETPVISIKLISDILDSETQKDDYARFEEKAEMILRDMLLKVL